MTNLNTHPGRHPAPAPTWALRACQDVTRHHSKTFYLGSRFFPREQRLAVWAVYAACRTGDDIADETDAARATPALHAWWRGIQDVYELPPEHFGQHDATLTALAWAVRRYPIPLDAFHELYEGLRCDVAHRSFHDMHDLEVYCRRVAGVVGFMIAAISGYDGGPRTLQQALRLGQAMQLTNILRDVGEDARRGRVYLPDTVLREYGVTHADIQTGRVTPAYTALMRALSDVARTWYIEGRAGLPCLHGSARLAVASAASAYEGILDDLERHGFDNFSRRAHVGTTRKLGLVARAWWSLRQSPRA